MSTNATETASEAFEERRSFSLGKYHLFARLGTGGMADVYLAVARDAMNVTKLAVVKRLRDEQASEPEARDMFVNEARLAARLNHPNVIQTFEAGSECGCYFIAMEYVDGQPLSRIISRLKRANRRVDPALLARICSSALEGLHHAHELTDFDGTALQMIHRDVSPQNIMVTYDGRVKVVDFGIAKAVGTTQTAHGVFKGKVAFMAPEQLLSDKVDRRADLFSMGICLWEAVTGARLMAEDTPAKTLLNLMNKKIPPASEVNPEVPEKLVAVIAKALERDPAQRYSSAYEMHLALEDFIRNERTVTEHNLRDLVCEHFSEAREILQEQVREQVARLSSRAHSDRDLDNSQVRNLNTAVLLDLSEASDPDGTRTNRAVLRFGTTSTGSKLLAAGQAIDSARRPKKRVRGWVAIALAAMVGSGVAFALLLASGIAILRSQHITDRTAAHVKPPPLEEPKPAQARAVMIEEPVTIDLDPVTLPPPPAPPPAAKPAAAPVRAPVRPAPAAQRSAAAPATSPEMPAAGENVSTRGPSPATSQSATPTEAPQGRVFRREL